MQISNEIRIPKNARAWWYEYERLKHHPEKKLALFNATIQTELTEELNDLYDVVLENFDYIASTKDAGKAAEFLEHLKVAKPALYTRDRLWYDYHLLDCYASIGKREKVRSLTDAFLKDMDKNVDIAFHVLDTLRFYGYGVETKNLSVAIYQQLMNSAEVTIDVLEELGDLIAASVLSEYPSWEDCQTEEVVKRLENLGLNPVKEGVEAIETTISIFRGSSRNWVLTDFSKSKKSFRFNLFCLCTEFMNFLRVNYSFDYFTSDLFSWMTITFFVDLSREHKGKFHFTFPQEFLVSHLKRYYFHPLTLRRTVGVALLGVLMYFSDFLFQKKLITASEQRETQENMKQIIGGIKEMMRSQAYEYRFLENWAFQGKPLVDKSCFSPTTLLGASKVGRNEPCPCGSGKKYKKCCGRPDPKNS